MAADALEHGLPLACLASQRFQRLVEAGQRRLDVAAQQLQHAAVVQGRGFVQVDEEFGRRVQPAAQDQVLGQRGAQCHRRAALRDVFLGVGADRRRAGRLALHVVHQYREHVVAHAAIDAFHQVRFERPRADVDERMQVRGLVAAQAGGQDRCDRLRAFAGQQRETQQRDALAVAAQHRRALPVDAQRRHLLVDVAQRVELARAQRPRDRRPGEVLRDRVAARRQLDYHAVGAQAFERFGEVFLGRRGLAPVRERRQVLVDAAPAHRFAGQRQQREDQLAPPVAAFHLRMQDVVTHAARFSISTAGRFSGTGMPNTRR